MASSTMRWRFVAIFAVVILALFSVLPNFVEIDEESFLPNKKVVYGLDIQGGLHLVLGVDMETVVREQTQRTAAAIEEYLKDQGVTVSGAERAKEGNRYNIVISVSGADQAQRIRELIEKDWPNYLVLQANAENVVLRQSEISLDEMKTRTIEQSIETIRNRIDEFGVAEPSITAQGDDRILVQLPGIEDSTRAKELINKTARLEFMLVSQDEDAAKVGQWVEEAEQAGGYSLEGMTYREYVERINEDLKEKLEPNQKVLFQRAEGVEDMETGKVPYLLEKTPVGGDDLRDAYVGMGEMNEPIVSFNFNPDGARKFGKLTGENINRQLGIVLDDVLYSAPNIQSKITDRGQITLGGGRDYETQMEEAKTIAMALRAGALPARLEQLEERTVGPTLGADSIAKGRTAITIGGALVVLFMLFYYKSFGLLANLALFLNLYLILAVLTSLEATLTLPGIAGIALTIGMAVDANVIIFERIKEEYRLGKSRQASVTAGFQKAFWTIMDANITTVVYPMLHRDTGEIGVFWNRPSEGICCDALNWNSNINVYSRICDAHIFAVVYG